MAQTTTIADFYPRTKARPAQLDVHLIVDGRRTKTRVFDVRDKRDARDLAKGLGATPNNF